MIHRMFQRACSILAVLYGLSNSMQAIGQEFESRSFELRVYHLNEGGRQRFHQLMASPGIAYLSKHRMTLLGVWNPIDESDPRVVCLISHDNASCIASNWKSMLSDEAWSAERKLHEDSSQLAINDGNLKGSDRSKEVHTVSVRRSLPPSTMVRSVDQIILEKTPYSQEIQSKQSGHRVFELRTCVAKEGRLGFLHSRFRNHATQLMRKHHMEPIGYWNIDSEDRRTTHALTRIFSSDRRHVPHHSDVSNSEHPVPANQAMIVYLVAHESQAQAERSYHSFRRDQEWAKAFSDSERMAGGSLTEEHGMVSWYLRPTDYSPIQ